MVRAYFINKEFSDRLNELDSLAGAGSDLIFIKPVIHTSVCVVSIQKVSPIRLYCLHVYILSAICGKLYKFKM
jgi:hypothetical protein